MSRVEPDGMVHDLYDGRFWPAEIEDEPFYNRSTILRVIDEEIAKVGDYPITESALLVMNRDRVSTLRILRARFEEVVE